MGLVLGSSEEAENFLVKLCMAFEALANPLGAQDLRLLPSRRAQDNAQEWMDLRHFLRDQGRCVSTSNGSCSLHLVPPSDSGTTGEDRGD